MYSASVKRAIEIIIPGPVAGGPENLAHIEGIRGHNGRDGIVEMQMLLAGESSQGLGQGLGGQRPRGDHGGPLRVRVRHFFPDDFDERLGFQGPGDVTPRNSPRSTARALPAGTRVAAAAAMIRESSRRISSLSSPTALSDPFGPEGIAAHQLPQQRRLVGRRKFHRLHLKKTHPNPPAGRLPGRLTPRQPPADDGDGPVLRFAVCGLQWSCLANLSGQSDQFCRGGTCASARNSGATRREDLPKWVRGSRCLRRDQLLPKTVTH